MTIVIAIDAGTTGVRSLAIDHEGTVITSSYREFTQYFPQPGWVEHDPDEIWDRVQDTLADVCGALTEPIAAIGITNQRETICVWDRTTHRSVCRAIVWQDRRTADRCAELERDGHLPLIRSKTGLVLDPYFSASKLEWLHTQGGVNLDSTVAVGTIDSWLMYKLSGGTIHATDPTNASRTMLYDIFRNEWDEELCELFGVPMEVLGTVMPSCGLFGTTAATAACGAGIAIAGVAGDQQAALFGQCCFEPGMSKNTYGTGSFVLMNTGTVAPAPAEGLLTTVAWQLPGSLTGSTEQIVTHYALEGAIFVTGAAVQWLRDGLGIIHTSADVDTLASQVESTDDVYFVPAFAGLGSPHWDPYARGVIVGLTRGTTSAHLARATLESMAFQTRDVVDAMTAASGTPLAELRVDGGATASELMISMVADQLGVDVVRTAAHELTALGAAYLAGLATGVWPSLQALSDSWQVAQRVSPNPERGTTQQRYRRWKQAVTRSAGWVESARPETEDLTS